ncbi:hypothetical protein [Lacinutrix salivirga]
MRPLLLLFILLISLPIVAQDSTKLKAETPKIISKLEFGKSITVNAVELKFVKVVTDSRCPKNVQCVWAGEVEVLVDVFEDGKKTEQKVLKIPNAMPSTKMLGNLFSSEGLKITGLNVYPYPIHGVEKKNEEYYIQLDIRK